MVSAMGSMALFVLVKGVCFSGLFPFKVGAKQIQTEEQEKNLFGFLCVHLSMLSI